MSNYLYNGVELPALPEYDKETYPYAYIVGCLVSVYYIVLSTEPLYHKKASVGALLSYNHLYTKSDCTIVEYATENGDKLGRWVYLETTEKSANTNAWSDNGVSAAILWSNTDLRDYANDTLYLGASEPVPCNAQGEDSSTSYLFNGVQLPALPAYDKSVYPVALITKDDKGYWLELCPALIYRTREGKYEVGVAKPSKDCRIEYGDNAWSDFFTVTSIDTWLSEVGSDYIIWTNTDIMYADGTIALAASDPVPVGGNPTLPEGDFYKVVNGQWVKCETVKSNGSKWVAQDEYLY